MLVPWVLHFVRVTLSESPALLNFFNQSEIPCTGYAGHVA